MEIIAVVAIIAVLAAITTPVLLSVKAKSRETVCISNLRQCGMALLLYEGESGAFPVGSGSYEALAKSPTCDPADTWRPACQGPSSPPRVGSFGYVRLCPGFADETTWNAYLQSDSPPSLLISVYHGSKTVAPFEGMEPDYHRCFRDFSCVMPDRIISFRIDGSSKAHRNGTARLVERVPFELFNWPRAFVVGK